MIYAFGPFEIDVERYELRRDGTPSRLEPQVFDVIAYLVRNRDRVVTKQELLDNVWQTRFVSDAAISTRIKEARRVLEDDGRAQRVIRTVHGRGFRFVAEVDEAGAQAVEAPPAVRDSMLPASSSPPPPARRSNEAPPRPFGRSAELAQLEARFDLAKAGARQTVFVSGEPGLGKTTLVDAFLEEALGRGDVLVARGQSIEHRGDGEPYLPLLDAIGRLVRGPEGERIVDVLARFAPTWLVHLPWAAERFDSLEREVLTASKERMLRELVEAFDAIAEPAPVILAIEDLHWSDYSTLDVLAALARREDAARLLLVGTYRLGDATVGTHPAHEVATGLRLRHGALDLRLRGLPEAATAELIAARLSGSVPDTPLVDLVHRRSGGNPLFANLLIESWSRSGLLVERDGDWLPHNGLEALDSGVPETLRDLIEQQLVRLDAANLEMLEAASIVGLEASTATIAAAASLDEDEVERRGSALIRLGQFIVDGGVESWPDGVVSTRFAFRHSMFQEALYERVPAGRRARMHQRVGERIEEAFGDRADERAAELALHYMRSRDLQRAIRYLCMVAGVATQRFAYQEAIESLKRAIELARSLPDEHDRRVREADLRALLGPPLVGLYGWSHDEVEEAQRQASAILPTLQGAEAYPLYRWLATYREMRGEYVEAQELMERGQEALRFTPLDDAGEVVSHELLACSLLHQGRFAAALEQADAGVGIYDAGQHLMLMAIFDDNPGVSCLAWSGQALWFLGYEERARVRMDEALALVADPAHEFSTGHALEQVAVLYHCLDDPESVLRLADRMLEVARRQGSPYRIGIGNVFRGWALAVTGDSEGIRTIRDGIELYRSTGARMDLGYHLTLLADACARLGLVDEGLAAIDEAIALGGGERWYVWDSELRRLRGVLLAQRGADHFADAWASILEAIEVARRQESPALELRAALSLEAVTAAPAQLRAARRAVADARRRHPVPIADLATTGS